MNWRVLLAVALVITLGLAAAWQAVQSMGAILQASDIDALQDDAHIAERLSENAQATIRLTRLIRAAGTAFVGLSIAVYLLRRRRASRTDGALPPGGPDAAAPWVSSTPRPRRSCTWRG